MSLLLWKPSEDQVTQATVWKPGASPRLLLQSPVVGTSAAPRGFGGCYGVGDPSTCPQSPDRGCRWLRRLCCSVGHGVLSLPSHYG